MTRHARRKTVREYRDDYRREEVERRKVSQLVKPGYRESEAVGKHFETMCEKAFEAHGRKPGEYCFNRSAQLTGDYEHALSSLEDLRFRFRGDKSGAGKWAKHYGKKRKIYAYPIR